MSDFFNLTLCSAFAVSKSQCYCSSHETKLSLWQIKTLKISECLLGPILPQASHRLNLYPEIFWLSLVNSSLSYTHKQKHWCDTCPAGYGCELLSHVLLVTLRYLEYYFSSFLITRVLELLLPKISKNFILPYFKIVHT